MATASDDDDEQARRNELLAMESIYGHDGVFSCDQTTMAGLITMTIDSEQKVRIEPQAEDDDVLEVDSFPPVTVEFHLPASYPSRSPPSICVVSDWLTPVQMLKVWSHLDSLWRTECAAAGGGAGGGGGGVLFEYAEFLRSGLLPLLGVTAGGRLDVSYLLNRRHCQRRAQRATASGAAQLRQRYRLTLAVDADVRRVLADHQRRRRRQRFDTASHECGVCAERLVGTSCLRLALCGHVFCRDCLRQYYTLLIGEGSALSVVCPSAECRQQPLPSEVKELVGAELFERYDTFLLSTTLRTMSDVVPCPRAHCQKNVLLESDVSMGRCVNCDFVFCALCKRAYHGENPCSLDNEKRAAIVQAYRDASPEETQRLESIYGKRQLVRLVEEFESQQWIGTNSTPCPKCSSPIEKIDGCNKMVCTKCGVLFCWLCRARLPPATPYLHFNIPGQACFNKLFLGTDQDLPWPDEDEQEAAAAAAAAEDDDVSDEEADSVLGIFLS